MAVWIFYELPDLSSSVLHASFYACSVDGSCHAPEPWGVSWFTAMFMHGSWDHNGGGTAFFAHIGGFLFGLFVARVLAGTPARQPAAAAP